MPNRMLRDWTDSYRVDQLSWQAEVFFARLIMKADDYGRLPADTALIKANLFPRRLDTVREADISRWIDELISTINELEEKAGLIVLYQVRGRKYLQIEDFGQRLDKAKAKYPAPPISTDSMSESEREEEIELESEKEERPPKRKKFVTEKIELVYPFTSDKFMATWGILRSEKKWKNKSDNALQLSLKQLSEFDEEYAISLMEKAISGNYQGVVFQNTKADYLKTKNGNSTLKNNKAGVSQSNADKLQRIMDGDFNG